MTCNLKKYLPSESNIIGLIKTYDYQYLSCFVAENHGRDDSDKAEKVE